MNLIIIINYNFFLYISNIFPFKYFDYQSNQCRIIVLLSDVNGGGMFHNTCERLSFSHPQLLHSNTIIFFTIFFSNTIISNQSSQPHNPQNIPFSTLHISLKTINCIKRKNNNSNYIQFPNIGKYNKTTFYIYIILYTIKD